MKRLEKIFHRFQVRNQPKIFCIGMNKTGTTSLERTFRNLGYEVGNQTKAERLLPLYRSGDFDAIINYTKGAQVFQDIPFSLPTTYRYLRAAYPNAKFILTVRDDSTQWVNSLIKFHSKLFGEGTIPTADQLKRSNYVYPGFSWEAMECLGVSFDSPYDPIRLKAIYEKYNSEVEDFFRNESSSFLKLNLSSKHSFKKFIDFLGVETDMKSFPWENKTSNLNLSQ